MGQLIVVRVCESYQDILRRRPSAAEIGYWVKYLGTGGTESDIRYDLTQGYEFTAEACTAFAIAFRRRPSEGELEECRRLVTAGAPLVEAIRAVAA